MRNIFLPTFSLITYTILLLTGCGKTCLEATYSFSATEYFYPELDSIKIGDTLWVASSHSTIFKDSVSGRQADYTGSAFGLNMRLLNYTDSATITSGSPGAFDAFTTVVINGTAIGNDNLPNENKGVNYEQTQDSFILKVAFIPKKKGVYGISLGNAGATRLNHGCELATASVVNTNFDNHLYYYQRLVPNSEINSYERTHLYLFKVY